MQRQCSIAIVSALFVAGLLAFPHTGRCESINIGFETGDLTDWTAEGEAFEFQPTWGDNPTARGRGQASEHAGDWWLGLYEAYQGPEIGEALGQVAGAIQGDGPQGTLTSDDFSLIGETMNFLMGGGAHPWVDDAAPTCVNLVVNGDVVRTATGANTETFSRQEWDIADFKGERGHLVVVDNNGGGWGHPNFDDVHQADASGTNISWDRVLAVGAQGKLPVTWAHMKRYY
jgi:hypothetical protein